MKRDAGQGHAHVVDIRDLDELLALNGPDLAAGDSSSCLEASGDKLEQLSRCRQFRTQGSRE